MVDDGKPPLPRRGPAPPVSDMTNAALVALVEAADPYQGRALFELCDRVGADDDAATRVGALTRLASVRNTRLFDRVSLAWSAIVSLLAAETAHSRATAYAAFAALDADQQRDLLDYLECGRIEDAHPRVD